MTPQQLDLIPDALLKPGNHRTAKLLAYLNSRGLRLTLWDLDTERHRRGLYREGRR